MSSRRRAEDHLDVGAFLAAAGAPSPRPAPPIPHADRPRKLQTEAQKARVAAFLRGEPPVVLDPDEALGLSRSRSARVKGGVQPLEADDRVLRELAVDLGAGRRWTR